MYLYERHYHLVNPQGRNKYDLRLYREAIEEAVFIAFGKENIIAEVHKDHFALLIEYDAPMLPVGRLVNMGKQLARCLPDITADVMRIYKVKRGNDSKQLFRCFSATVT